MAERDPTTTIQHKGEFHCSLDIDDGHGIGFLTCLVSVFELFFLFLTVKYPLWLVDSMALATHSYGQKPSLVG